MLIPFNLLPVKKIRGIIHIGAHECEELDTYIHDCQRSILWVEANPEKEKAIQRKIAMHNTMRSACFAASNIENPNAILHIASNGQSSSLLEFGSHADHHPTITYINNVCTSEQRIDCFIEKQGIHIKEYNFINLDIQGYELKALQGASGILSHIDFIYTEVNIESVYNDCARLEEIDEYLSMYGFSRTWTVMTKNGWGDAFYSRGNRFLAKGTFVFRAIATKIRKKVVNSAKSNQ